MVQLGSCVRVKSEHSSSHKGTVTRIWGDVDEYYEVKFEDGLLVSYLLFEIEEVQPNTKQENNNFEKAYS